MKIWFEQEPDVVLDIHRKYLEAGADLIEKDTFGGAPLRAGEYGLAADAHELNKRAQNWRGRRLMNSARRKATVCRRVRADNESDYVTGGVTFEDIA